MLDVVLFRSDGAFSFKILQFRKDYWSVRKNRVQRCVHLMREVSLYRIQVNWLTLPLLKTNNLWNVSNEYFYLQFLVLVSIYFGWRKLFKSVIQESIFIRNRDFDLILMSCNFAHLIIFRILKNLFGLLILRSSLQCTVMRTQVRIWLFILKVKCLRSYIFL